MKEKILFLMCLSLLTPLSVSAQTKTVTNADLKKFRSQRLTAEKDLRENYEALGFPSPEEREKRLEKSRIETETLSAKFRAERIEREKLAAEISIRRQSEYYSFFNGYQYYPLQTGGYFGGSFSNRYYDPRGSKRFWHRIYPGQAWRADGSGIVYEPGSRPAAIWTPRTRTLWR